MPGEVVLGAVATGTVAPKTSLSATLPKGLAVPACKGHSLGSDWDCVGLIVSVLAGLCWR